MATTTGEWMSAIEARMVLGIGETTLLKLANQSRIGTLQIPGVRGRKYRRADVDALASASIRPATATGVPEMASV